MPQKSNYDYKEKYPYDHASTLEPILTKTVFLPYASVLEYE